MSDPRLDILEPVLRDRALDAVAIVPGPNFRKIFDKSFYQNERPLVIICQREGGSLAIVPNLELASFADIDFSGEVFDWRDEAGYQAAFEAAAAKMPPQARIGVEGQLMRVFVQMAFARALPGAEFVDAHREVSAIRLRKSASDLARMRKAIAISEEALERTVSEVRAGMTETEVEGILLRNLFACGSDGLAFSPIVAAGGNSAQPHAKARPDYQIRPGDALLIDFGASHRGYQADITRTFFIDHVSDGDREFYATVRAANAAGRQAVRPGTTAHQVDDTVQKVLENSPFARYRRTKTGHGLGMEVHEDPYIMRGNHDALEPGMVFTVEPGLYRLGDCGVRIEDVVAVTETGMECLTAFPRDLRIVG